MLVSLALLVGMLVVSAVGIRLGKRVHAGEGVAKEGTSTVEAAVFALLGLLLAFTFSGATQRLEVRRQLIVEEVNAVGTAWLRLAVLPEATQSPLRDAFRRYVDARLEGYRSLADEATAVAAFARAEQLRGEIWAGTVAAAKGPGTADGTLQLMLPPLNEMFDVVTKRAMALRTHPPQIIYWMLVVLAWTSALFAGYSLGACGSRKRLHIVTFAVAVALTVYVTMDIEHPRRGFVRVDDFDQAMIAMRESMK